MTTKTFGVLAVIAAVCTSCSTSGIRHESVPPVTRSTQDIMAGKWYFIRSNMSGLYLDVKQGNKDVGGAICQAVKHPDQVWQLEKAEKDGYFYIRSNMSGLYLDVKQGNKDVGGAICQAVKHPDQVWQLEKAEKDGYFYIRSNVSGLCLDVKNGDRNVGVDICQAVKHPDQIWAFEVKE